MRTSIAIAASFLLIPSALAGVLVIDAANGPGTDFTTLDTALAAAHAGDILLVRSGTYTASHVVTKNLSIVEDAGAQVIMRDIPSPGAGGPLSVLASSLGNGFVAVIGPRLDAYGAGASAFVSGVPAAASPIVYLEGVDSHPTGAFGLHLLSTCPTIASHCEWRGSTAVELLPGNGAGAPSPALGIVSSAAALFDSSIRGGDGLVAGDYVFPWGENVVPGGSGAAGLVSLEFASAKRFLSGCELRGGDGGEGVFWVPTAACLAPGNGGPAIDSTGTEPAILIGTSCSGGAGGDPGATCSGSGASGALFELDPFFLYPPVTWSGAPASLESLGPAREGQAVGVRLDGTPGHAAYLVLGLAPTFLPAPSLGGALVVEPLLVLDLGTIPAGGSIVLSATLQDLGAGLEGRIAFAQPITRESPSSRPTLGAPTAIVMLDSSIP